MKEIKTNIMKDAIKLAQGSILVFLVSILEMIQSSMNNIANSNNNLLLKEAILSILELLGAIVYFPAKALETFLNSTLRKISLKEIFKNKEFVEFMNSDFKKEYFISDKVHVTLNIDSNDYNNLMDLYEAYNNALSVMKELNENVSDDIKYGMSALDSKIHIRSKSIYEKYYGKDSAGCFDSGNKSINLLLIEDLDYSLVALHHEIAHFIDYVVGFDLSEGCFGMFSSDEDLILHDAFKRESDFLRDYAKKNYAEFFAVAYEYKMTNGNMSNLELINSRIENYLACFKYMINCIEDIKRKCFA